MPLQKEPFELHWQVLPTPSDRHSPRQHSASTAQVAPVALQRSTHCPLRHAWRSGHVPQSTACPQLPVVVPQTRAPQDVDAGSGTHGGGGVTQAPPSQTSPLPQQATVPSKAVQTLAASPPHGGGGGGGGVDRGRVHTPSRHRPEQHCRP